MGRLTAQLDPSVIAAWRRSAFIRWTGWTLGRDQSINQ